MYSLLNTINSPQQLRDLSRDQLDELVSQLREFLIESVSKTGGHLSSNLGTVELTVALHYIFNTPEDPLVWDVGHQTYAHKILTGRREAMSQLRMAGGFLVFLSVMRVLMTALVWDIPVPLSARHWGWR